MFLANVRMAYKLGLGFAVMTFLTLALGGISVWQMGQMHSSTQVVTQHTLPSVADIGNMRALWNRLRRAEAGVLNVNSVAEVEGYVTQIAQLLAQIESLEKHYTALDLDAKEKELYQQYLDARQQYMQSHQEFLQLARDKDYTQLEGDLLLGDAVTNFYVGVAEPLFVRTAESLGKLAELGRQYSEAAQQDVSRSFQFAMAWVWAGMALSAIAAAILGWLIARAVTQPVAQAMRAARAISQGDLTQEIPQGGGDEMGKLLQELAMMRDNLERVVSHVRLNADGVAISSEQIALGNTDLSGRTEQQASALQQTAASMEQMASTVRHNADTAAQANQLALNASSVAGRGGDVVAQVVSTMKDIDTSSQKIADIIGVIDGIAFQTNILALNAAVEAARAGEQGRGFAVVAGEVRALAGRSADAAKEIKSLIGESVNRVALGATLVEQAGTTMDEVVASIRQVSDLVGEISAASREQSQGVGQVTEAIAQMDQTTQQNAALVEESAAAAEGLKRQAKDLVDAVSSFKLKQAAGFSEGATAAAVNIQRTPQPSVLRAALKADKSESLAIRNSKPSKEKDVLQSPVAKTVGEDDWTSF